MNTQNIINTLFTDPACKDRADNALHFSWNNRTEWAVSSALNDHRVLLQAKPHITEGHLVPELQQLIRRMRVSFPDIKVALHHHTNYTYDGADRALSRQHATFYFEGDDYAFVRVKKRNTRRSEKPGFLVQCVNYEQMESVNIQKLHKFIVNKAVRITPEMEAARAMRYNSDEPSRNLYTYKQKLRNAKGYILIDQLLGTFRWLTENDIVIPDADLRRRMQEAIDAEDELNAKVDAHKNMIAVYDMGDGRIALGAIPDAHDDRMKLDGMIIVPQAETPMDIQMRVATLSGVENRTFVEDVGLKYSSKLYYVVVGDIHA